MVQAQRMVNAVHINVIAEITERQPRTVRGWMNGEAIKSKTQASLLPDFAIEDFAFQLESTLGINYEQEFKNAIQEYELHKDSEYHYLYLKERIQREHGEIMLNAKIDGLELEVMEIPKLEKAIDEWKKKSDEWKSKLEEWKQGGNEVETELQRVEMEKTEISTKLQEVESERKRVETEKREVETNLQRVEMEKSELAEKLEGLEGSGKLKTIGRKFSTFTQSLVFLYLFILVMIAAETIAHFVVTSSVFDTNPTHAYLAAGLFQVAAFIVYTNDNLKAAFGFDSKQVLNTITGYNFLMNIAVLFWSFDWAMDAPQLVGNILVRVMIAFGFAAIIKVIGTIIISKQKQVA